MNAHPIRTAAGRLAAALLLVFALPVQAQDWLWARSGGGAGMDLSPSVATDVQGHTYATGTFHDTATFGPYALTSAGSLDVFLVKYAPDGEVLWARCAGGTGEDVGHGIAVDANGDVLLTGSFTGTADFGDFALSSAGLSDAFLVKYAADGAVLGAVRGGGPGHDQGQSVAVDALGFAYVTGQFSDTASFGPFPLVSVGWYDLFVVKYAPTGEAVWARSGGGTYVDKGLGVAADAGGAFVTGAFVWVATFGDVTLSSAGHEDVLLVRYSAEGEVLWAHRAGGGFDDAGRDVAVDGEGNAYLTGEFADTATFGPHLLTSAGWDDVFVAKYGPDGGVVWAEPGGGSTFDRGSGVAVDAGGIAYVTGSFYGGAAFGPFALTSAGGGGAFLARYGPDGAVLGANSGGGPYDDAGEAVSVDSSGNAYVAGTFGGTATFGPFTIASAGAQDVFVAKYGPSPAVTVSAAPVSPPVVLPPAGGAFPFTVTLTNTTGELQTVQVWTAVTGPASREPVLGPITVTLPPGAAVTRTLTQQVPGVAPAGTYTYHVRLGAFPAPVAAGASFPFEKEAGAARETAAYEASGWTVRGWGEAVEGSVSAALPGGYALSAAHPNPSTGTARLTLEVAERQRVRAEAFDRLGRRVAVLLDGEVEAGAHALALEGTALPAGVYIVRVAGETFFAARRATFVR